MKSAVDVIKEFNVLHMNTNYNIYATNPFPNFTRTNFDVTREDEQMAETITAKRIRKRLYQNDKPSYNRTNQFTTNRTTSIQRQNIVKDRALAILAEPDAIDTKEIEKIMTQWAKDDLGIDEAVGGRIFSNAHITTEAIPQRSTFKIVIKF